MSAETERFYVVWNPRFGPPTMRHPSYMSAKNEARRLANANPGQQFFVLGALSMHRKLDPVEDVELDGPLTVPAHLVPDEIPF